MGIDYHRSKCKTLFSTEIVGVLVILLVMFILFEHRIWIPKDLELTAMFEGKCNAGYECGHMRAQGWLRRPVSMDFLVISKISHCAGRRTFRILIPKDLVSRAIV